jgi:hypothetical protein
LIDYAQADLLIGLDKNEAMLNLPYLKRGGKAVVWKINQNRCSAFSSIGKSK